MNVNISGTVLSALFYEHGNSRSDLEGFLLGSISHHVTDTISDSQMKTSKEHTTCYILSYVVCRRPCLWYDGAGKISSTKLKETLRGHKLEDVVGWFKFRRSSSLRPSLRESYLHHHLTDCFPNVVPKHFTFLLVTPTISTLRSTHDMEHVFLSYNGRSFTGLPITVVNLGDTVNSEYKVQQSGGIGSETAGLSRRPDHLRAEFESADGELHSVQGIRKLNTSLHKDLQLACQTVLSSEEELRKLRESVRTLKARLQPKPVLSESQPLPNTANPFHMSVPAPNHHGNPFSSRRVTPPAFPDPPPVLQYPADKNPFTPPVDDLISLQDDEVPTAPRRQRTPQPTRRSNVDDLLELHESPLPHPVLRPQGSQDSDGRAGSGRSAKVGGGVIQVSSSEEEMDVGPQQSEFPTF